MEGPLGGCLEGRTANLYRQCLNDGEPVLISNLRFAALGYSTRFRYQRRNSKRGKDYPKKLSTSDHSRNGRSCLRTNLMPKGRCLKPQQDKPINTIGG